MKRFLSLLLTAMMIFSCVSFTASAEETGTETVEPAAPAFALFTGNRGLTMESPNAIAGTKILFTVPGADAVYYNNGTPITATAGMAADTVAVDVVAGINKYTAVAGGTTYGPITIYGYTPVNDGTVIGANVGKGGTVNVGSDAELLEASPAELANLIDAGHPYAYKVGSTDTAVKYKMSSGMKSRSHYAAALGFYVDGTLAEAVMEERPIVPAEPTEPEATPVDEPAGEPTDEPTEPEAPTTEWVEVVPAEYFRLYCAQNSGNPYLAVFVGPKNHLYVRGYSETGFGTDTGVEITPNVWHDLGIAISWNIDTIASIYVDGQLVVKTNIKSPGYVTNGTISDRWYHYPAICAAGKGYIGEPTSAPVFAEFPVRTSSKDSSVTYKLAVNRNETVNLPSASITAEEDENTVTFSANIPAELAGAEAKILVNGAVANTTANGEKTIILSNVAIENAEVVAAIVDAQGNILTGFKGEPIVSAPITMNIAVQGIEPIMSDVEFYAVKGKGLGEYPYAVEGSKVLVVPPTAVNFDEATMHIAYFSGTTDVTASTVAGPFAGTVAVPVVAGAEYLTAKVVDTATGTVLADTNELPLRTISLTAGEEINAFTAKASNFTNVTDTLTADLASEDAAVKAKAEALLAGDRVVYQTKATAANSGAQLKSFVTKAAGEATGHTSSAYTDALEISYDFYLDEAFAAREGDANFYMFGFNIDASAALKALFGSTAGINRMGSYYRVFKAEGSSDMYVYASGVSTGVKVETGKWYNVTYYIDAHTNRVDFYLDGVLISKAGVQGNGSVFDLDKQVVYALAPYSGATGGYNNEAYFSNATINATREYSFAPSIYAVADDAADTLTVTVRDIDTSKQSAYLFLNGAQFPTAIPFTGDTFVLEGLTGYSKVSVAIVEDGAVAKGFFGDDLQTFTFAMTDAETTEAVSNGVITADKAAFTLVKRNIAEADLAKISIITIKEDGTIAVTPFAFEEADEYKLVEIAEEGLAKVFVWNLGDLRALGKAIAK